MKDSTLLLIAGLGAAYLYFKDKTPAGEDVGSFTTGGIASGSNTFMKPTTTGQGVNEINRVIDSGEKLRSQAGTAVRIGDTAGGGLYKQTYPTAQGVKSEVVSVTAAPRTSTVSKTTSSGGGTSSVGLTSFDRMILANKGQAATIQNAQLSGLL